MHQSSALFKEERIPSPTTHPDELRGISFFERARPKNDTVQSKIDLPVDPYIPEFLKTVRENPVTIVVAETGSGKSTRLPPALLDDGYYVVTTQPRRLAARTLAERVASERGEALGDVVGYRTALEKCDSPFTKLLYCTDGLALVTELNRTFSGQNKVLVLDEVHEFNSNIEVLLAWAKLQTRINPDFKLVIMSATVEQERLSKYFNNAPVVEIPGRQHEIIELKPGPNLAQHAVKELKRGHNVLIFQPGKAEIEKTIQDLLDSNVDAELLPLHADLLPEEQALCFKSYDRPKCVVATNVAQTSITIPDIDVVLDSGLEKRVEIMHGVEGLYTRPISIADRMQRQGRAGRTKTGYYCDYCPTKQRGRLAFPVAEIERTHLDQEVLRLAGAGIDMAKLPFFHQPERTRIHAAKDMLRALGCLTTENTVTDMGRKVAALPVSARTGRMLIEAHERHVSEDMVTIAAIYEVKGIHNHSIPEWKEAVGGDADSDLIAELKLFRLGCDIVADQTKTKLERKTALEDLGIVPRLFFKALETRHHIADMFKATIGELSSTGTREDILRSICAGMKDNVFVLTGDGKHYRSTTASGIKRELSRNSVLDDKPDIIVGKPWDLEIKTSSGRKLLSLIEMATKIEPKWLKEGV